MPSPLNSKMVKNCLKKLLQLFKHHKVFTLMMCLCKLAPALLVSLINPFVTSILDEELKGKPFIRGLSLSMNFIFSFLTSMFFGYYSEWSLVGRNAIITFGIILMGTASIFIGISKKWWQILLCLVASGTGFAATISCTYSLIMDVIPEDLIVFAVTTVEFAEALGWTFSPFIFGNIHKKDSEVFYPFLAFGLSQYAMAVCICVVLYFNLKPVKIKAKEEKNTTKVSLGKRLKLIFTPRETYMALLVNMTTCFSFHAVSSTLSKYLKKTGKEDLVSTFFSVPASPIAVLTIPILCLLIPKTYYVTFALPFLAILYFFHGDYPVNKMLDGVTHYKYSMIAVIFFRDYLFWCSYIICNFLFMEVIALRYPNYELKGLCGGLYVFSFNLGDMLGQFFSGFMYDKVGFNGITHILTGVLGGTFLVILPLAFFRSGNKGKEKLMGRENNLVSSGKSKDKDKSGDKDIRNCEGISEKEKNDDENV